MTNLQSGSQPNPIRWFLFFTTLFLVLGVALLASPQRAYAASCSGLLDYGDAPSSYGVACSTPNAMLRIGSTTPTVAPFVQCNTGLANCDAADNFLNPLTPIDLANSQYIWTVPVSNTTGSSATLAGWIDFNQNGTFDASELASATVTSGSTAVTITWNIPITATAVTATTYVRLRIIPSTTAGDIQSTGNFPLLSSIGEVEDYAVSIIESDVCAPGTSFYVIDGTTTTSTIFRLYDVATGGSTLVADPPQGRTNGIAVDRYRGMIYYQDATAGGIAGANDILGYNVVAGTFFTVTTNASGAPLNIPLPQFGWRNASGAFANGKYYAGLDGEDNNTPSQNQTGAVYEITLSSDGLSPISARVLVTPTGSSGGDQITNRVNWGDLIVVANRLYVAYYVASETNFRHIFDVYDINSGIRLTRQDLGTLNDADPPQLGRDGNGQIWLVRNNATASATSVYTVTNNAVVGFPSSPRNTIGYNVVDAAECPVVAMDFGDAPGTYSPNVGPLAARHQLISTLGLGPSPVQSDLIRRDLHGFASTLANGDDNNNYNGSAAGTDDENSGAVIQSLDSSATTYKVSNITAFNNTGQTATLYAWADFNRDGVFQQSERVTVSIPSSALTQVVTVTWPSLPTLMSGTSYIRLRLSTSTVTTSALGGGNDGAFLATGYAPNGELEDYVFQIQSPTAVRLSSFGAMLSADVPVALSWASGSEVNTAGFNIYRSENKDGAYTRINAQLIPAANTVSGNRYQYLDTTAVPGKTYYYQLEDIELNGKSTRHPPIAVNAPQASGFASGLPIALGALIVVCAGLLVSQKKLNVF